MSTERDHYARHSEELRRREFAAGALNDLTPPPPEREYEPWEVLTRQDEQSQRNDWYKRTILNCFENPAMQDVVAAAHRLTGSAAGVPWKRSSRVDYLNAATGSTADARTYREWVREMLKKSDLAQRIPGGREALPDIYDAMREPWRSIEKLHEPRDYDQLVQHLVKHLDWYLDPAQPVKPPFALIRNGLLLVGIVGSITAALVLPGLNLDPMFVLVPVAVAAGITFLSAKIWGKHKTARGEVFRHYELRNLIHSAELYYYLVDAWLDPKVLEEPAEL